MQTHTIFPTAAKAQEIADRCAADDAGDGYNYLVVEFPNGRAVIEIYDETGYKLGCL
jgi:hypothetical protein